MMEQNRPLRVLQILNHMDYGGIEAVVMNYYRHVDRERLQFDFAVCADSSLPQRKEIERLGGNIYLLPPVSHLPQYVRSLKKLIKEHGYEIVHCHMNTLSVFPLYAAWRAGARVRICHNHTTAHKGEGARTVLKYLLRPCNKWFATDYFACSEYAGRWMYGRKRWDAGEVHVVRNAIDIEKFSFEPVVRTFIRQQLGVENHFVVGHIGRFTYQKNHEFLIDVFWEIQKQRSNAVLLLVGEGELEESIQEKVRRLGIAKQVIFYGTSKDTSFLYQAMDLFLFPSHYEGMGIVTIEAQSCGLPVIASRAIPAEAALTSIFQFAALEIQEWTKAAMQIQEKERRGRGSEISGAGYNIKLEADRLMEKYIKSNQKIDRRNI